MNDRNLDDILKEIALKYPSEIVHEQLRDIPRIAFNITTSLNAVKNKPVQELEACDLGGGIGLFSVGLAVSELKRVVLVDDFNDQINHEFGDSLFDIHKSFGINVVSRDIVKDGISDINGTFDIISTFDSMEHWHDSPKKLFHEIIKKLKPGGVFVLGGPNCVNIRKRVFTLLGKNKWSSMKEWYEVDKFRGHVREPDVDDLKYIAHDMGLTDIKIYGRNWLGYHSLNPVVRFITKITDFPMRLRPSICSDIYLVGRKK